MNRWPVLSQIPRRGRGPAADVAEAIEAFCTAKRRLYEAECFLTGKSIVENEDLAKPTITNFGHIVRHFGAEQLGPRTAGSTTDSALHDVIPHDTPVHEFRPHKDVDFAPARYFTVRKADVHPEVWEKLRPRLGAKAFDELTDEERRLVKVRPSHSWGKARNGDGRELYLDRPPHEKHMADAAHLTFIMGPDRQGKLIPWTWFPGDPQAVHDSANDRGKDDTNVGRQPGSEDFENPNPQSKTAVKLHSGA